MGGAICIRSNLLFPRGFKSSGSVIQVGLTHRALPEYFEAGCILSISVIIPPELELEPHPRCAMHTPKDRTYRAPFRGQSIRILAVNTYDARTFSRDAHLP